MMVKDHSAANEKLKSLAGSNSISLPTSAGVGQMSAHEEDIAEFNKEATSGKDPDAKAFATATLLINRASEEDARASPGRSG